MNKNKPEPFLIRDRRGGPVVIVFVSGSSVPGSSPPGAGDEANMLKVSYQ